MPQEKGIPPHFIVIVPGIMGTKLVHKDSGRLVWGDPWQVVRNLRRELKWHEQVMPSKYIEQWVTELSYPDDEHSELSPAGIMDRVVWARPWAVHNHYNRLFEKLRDWGYKTGDEYEEGERDVYAFGYD